MNLYLDIETVPSQAPDAIELVRETIRPPGTLKKPESIAAWWETEADSAATEAWRKQALDGGNYGEVVSIAVTDGDGREWVQCRAQGQSEGTLLLALVATVEGWEREDASKAQGNPGAWPVDAHYPVAHNAAFDLGFLWRRMAAHRVRIPRWLPSPLERPGKAFGCTMQARAGFGKFVALDTLCDVLHVPSPKADGMDGSMVLDTWLAGDTDKVAAYNLRDAKAVAHVWQVLQGVGAV